MLTEIAPASLGAQQHAERITAAYRRTVEAIVATGKALLEAKAELPHGSFTTMIEKQLPFSDRTAQSLMAIAKNAALANPKNFSDLPASSSVLALLAKVPAKEIGKRLEAGEINAETSYRQAKELADYAALSRYRPRAVSPAPELTAATRIFREAAGWQPGNGEARRLPRPATVEGEAQRIADDAPEVVELELVSPTNTANVEEPADAQPATEAPPTPAQKAPEVERVEAHAAPAPAPALATVTLSWRDDPKDMLYAWGQFLKTATDNNLVAELAIRCVDAMKGDPARLVRVRNRIAKHRTGKPLGQGEFFEALAPILVGLEAEGQKNMATANPGAVAVLSHKLALLAETYAATVESEK